MDKNKRISDPREKVLFETRQRILTNMESAIFRFVILLFLVYFFTSIIAFAAMVQGKFPYLVTVPFVQWVSEGLVLIIILLLLWLIWNILAWRSKWYIITNQRVLIKSGVISKKSVYMHYNKMQDIVVSQGIIQRISYSGNIEIFGGRDRTNLILENIPNPSDVEGRINQMIENTTDEPNTYKQKRSWDKYGEYDK